MNKSIEVLSPAGSFESLVAAVNASADAVYLGGSMFGARAYANNFDNDELLKAIRYAHKYDVKIYLTINTLFRDDELISLYNYLLPFYEAGLDAVIVQDLGVLNFVREHFPDMDIHASTQMSLTGAYGAALLKEMGASRVVTAREISLKEIENIHKNVDIEIESFVHGAMCYSYSGQCLLSSFIGGRSGNRGRCAQACRLPYGVNGRESYLLSLKDMCTLDILPDIIDAGVYFLKIEGRMKSPEYTAFVTAMYRKYADMYISGGRDGYKVDKNDVTALLDLYNRGGSITGYYNVRNKAEMLADKKPNHQGVPVGKVLARKKNDVTLNLTETVNSQDVLDVKDKFEYTLGEGKAKGNTLLLKVSKDSKLKAGDIVYRTKNQSLLNDIRKKYIENNRKIPIDIRFEACDNKKALLKLSHKEYTVRVYADILSVAQNRPTTAEDVKKQLTKLGNTDYTADKTDIDMGDNLFIPLKSLNDMRRAAIDDMEELLCTKPVKRQIKPVKQSAHFDEPVEKRKANDTSSLPLSVLSENFETVLKVIENKNVTRVYMESYNAFKCDINLLMEKAHLTGKEFYIALPYVLRDNSYKAMEKLLKLPADGFLVRNLEEYAYIREQNDTRRLIFDYNMYAYNSAAEELFVKEWGGGYTLGAELNEKQLSQMDCTEGELIVYGYLPMMISAGCINKNTDKCDGITKYIKVSDRCKNDFYVKNVCEDCYNIIYNSKPIVLSDKWEEIKNISPGGLRIMLNETDKDYVDDIIADVVNHTNNVKNYTRGHFLRGVQ